MKLTGRWRSTGRSAQEGYKDKKFADYVEELEARWKPRSEEHRKARAFLYGKWPKLTTTQELLDYAKEADDNLDICIAAKDRAVSAGRLVNANVVHGRKAEQGIGPFENRPEPPRM